MPAYRRGMRHTRVPYWPAERCEEVGANHYHLDQFDAHAHASTSKRSGLEKAIFQVEEAIKRRKSDAPSSRATLDHLQNLLNEAQRDENQSPPQPRPHSFSTPYSPGTKVTERANTLHSTASDVTATATDDQLAALEDAENPLQLLARASDLRITSPHSFDDSAPTPGSKMNGSEQSAFLDVHRFFLPMKASLDQGPGLDPIDNGLISKQEAETLLA
jgi:hypothetical protein